MPTQSMQDYWQASYLSAASDSYLDELYDTYLTDPQSLLPAWRGFFTALMAAHPPSQVEIPQAVIRQSCVARALQPMPLEVEQGLSSSDTQSAALALQIVELITAYRRLGHLQAKIDPLNLYQGVAHPALSLLHYPLLDLSLPLPAVIAQQFSPPLATLKELMHTLQKIYCGSIGFEYLHINRIDEVEWINQYIETQWLNFSLDQQVKQRLLRDLLEAEGLEKYLGMKYVGQKRFSLEGGDTLIPCLRTVLQHSATVGVKEVVIGMTHRGRLNVMINVVGRNPQDIFAAFEGKGVSSTHSGDVKYHLGYSANVETAAGYVHVALAFNPSHLEIISPVVQGSVRARQRRRRDTDKQQVLPIYIHGDAAFAGQGVVMETFSMSQARWFGVGGGVHIVINNQIGFTTSEVLDARSTLYCTDIAKMVEAPILHVNGNDPEAVYFCTLFALAYRSQFKRDVVIDLVCYRRHGHNEADEPSATQPKMYEVIKSLPTPAALYYEQLIQADMVSSTAATAWRDEYRHTLEAGQGVVPVSADQSVYAFSAAWKPFVGQPWTAAADTTVSADTVQAIAKQLAVLPENFTLQPQVKKILDARKQMTSGKLSMNWGYAETLAYATLLMEGYPIRLCGQDVGRGTFAHRHAVLYEQKTGESYVPLGHLNGQKAQINIIDSLLSEEAVLAFEYGYAAAEPNNLVIWEAQFGDFVNGAQVVIDQFIASGEQKWHRLCGLVLFLPHGYEGQGPEHSSARLERFLQLAAQENIQICVPSTPAQLFHLLRRQMLRPYRKPLVVLTPKSLLRHPLAVSPLSALSEQGFHTILSEVEQLNAEAIEQLIFCSGKIYYELLEKRKKLGKQTIAILRIEQLYPFPVEDCCALLAQYPQAKQVIWCQEEPKNQGAWMSIQEELSALLKHQSLQYVGRAPAASPAVGYQAVHLQEQEALVVQALTI